MNAKDCASVCTIKDRAKLRANMKTVFFFEVALTNLSSAAKSTLFHSFKILTQMNVMLSNIDALHRLCLADNDRCSTCSKESSPQPVDPVDKLLR